MSKIELQVVDISQSTQGALLLTLDGSRCGGHSAKSGLATDFRSCQR